MLRPHLLDLSNNKVTPVWLQVYQHGRAVQLHNVAELPEHLGLWFCALDAPAHSMPTAKPPGADVLEATTRLAYSV